jgi:hypothetical protein
MGNMRQNALKSVSLMSTLFILFSHGKLQQNKEAD